MTSLKRFLMLEWMAAKLEVMSRLRYRGDFLVSIFAISLGHILVPFYLVVLYGATQGIPGWEFAEILLFIGYFSLAEAFAYMFLMGVMWNTLISVQNGQFDKYLLLPGNTMANFINFSVDIEDGGRLIASTLIFGAGVHLTGISLGTVLWLLAYLIFPVLVFGSIGITTSALAIRFVSTWKIYDISAIFSTFAKYPANVYPKVIAAVLLTLVPLAVAGYVPAAVALGKISTGALWFALFAVMTFIVSIKYWYSCLRHYTSAGG